MSLDCWKSIKSSSLNQFPTTLKAFDGWGFQPSRLLQYLVIKLGGKTFFIDVEVVDAPLDYNFLFGQRFFYVMNVFAY
jgi:hypothetical protein